MDVNDFSLSVRINGYAVTRSFVRIARNAYVELPFVFERISANGNGYEIAVRFPEYGYGINVLALFCDIPRAYRLCRSFFSVDIFERARNAESFSERYIERAAVRRRNVNGIRNYAYVCAERVIDKQR